ncbi:hypothetical protein [Nisaea sp.]|uniref:tetratricopeptide repeat protein n=1 Tax=Nisaea sp. TaxID=2024842 RepID=UPI0032EF5F0F
MPESRDSLLADCRQLMATGKWNEARSRLEHALAAAPTDVLIAYTLATAYRLSAAADRAVPLFGNLHNAVPDMPEAAVGLAFSLAELGRTRDAETVLRRFSVRHPGQASPYTALGEIRLKSGMFDGLSRPFAAATAIAPSADALGNLAEILSHERSFDAAERLYRLALEKTPGVPSLELNYAVHLLSQGLLEEGWKHFEARLDPALPDSPIRTLSLPRWDGMAAADRHLLVVSEQGLGDEIRLGAMLPILAENAGSLTVECDPRLLPLYRRSMPSVTFHAFSRVKRSGRGHYSYGWLPKDDGPDCYIEIGSLPLMLTRGQIPLGHTDGFLTTSKPLQDRIGSTLRATAGDRHLVGLSWASGAKQFGRAANYPPLDSWRQLLNLPDICLVSLQYGTAAESVKEMSETIGREILHLDELDLRDDLDSLAALEASLDLVLSVGNATAALAGAVGTTTLELLSFPGWVPLLEEQDFFLGATRRIAQRQLGDWKYPVERARALALRHLGKR